ncbi:MAG: DUF1573 domain-containing protein [Chitinophagaceae bacterium]|nr:DUF1573 domain-containing protein [Chitinophagaceae bacterium]
MKKIFLTLLVAVGMTSVISAQTAPSTGGTSSVISFASEKHDFGTIPQGTPVTYNFAFTNTGKEPLIITGAVGSCGCTVPEYTKEAIAPGAKGTIKVTYNAAALGTINRTVTVNTNSATTPVVVLSIGGEVKAVASNAANTAAPVPAKPATAVAPKKN